MNQKYWIAKIRSFVLTLIFCIGIFTIISSCGDGGDYDDIEVANNANALWVQGPPPFSDLTVHFTECNVNEHESIEYESVRDQNGDLVEWKWQITLFDGNCEGQTVNLIIYPMNGTYFHLDRIFDIQP